MSSGRKLLKWKEISTIISPKRASDDELIKSGENVQVQVVIHSFFYEMTIWQSFPSTHSLAQ